MGIIWWGQKFQLQQEHLNRNWKGAKGKKQLFGAILVNIMVEKFCSFCMLPREI